ncbi:MAG TPA: hypothetical protein VMF52_21955 [Steroidobacteraceae bacterium]|nr:hypothetical protein [Steroidobacteraceae bacterium]
MGEFNPYAPSQASMASRPVSAGAGENVWRDGSVVVMLHGASLPHRCVKCNQPAEEPVKTRTVYYAHPAIYLLLLINFLILLIVYLVVRKKGEIDPGLCAHHRQRRLLGLTLGWGGFFGGVVVLILGVASDTAVAAIAGMLMMIGAIVAGMVWGRFVYPKKITKEEIRLAGFCSEYVVELPEYRG